MSDRCEVCNGAEKLTFTVTRHGLNVDYRTPYTFSGVAMYCPKCGKNMSHWNRLYDHKKPKVG